LTGLNINNVVGEISTLKMDLLGSKILEIDENLVEIGSKKADLNFSGIFLKDINTNIKMFKENKLLDKNIFYEEKKQTEVSAEKETKPFKGVIPASIMQVLVEQSNFVFPKFTKNFKFFFPKIKPWGFTGTLVFWTAVLNALGSWTFGFITSDQMIAVIQTAALAGTVLAAAALLYRKFLAKIKNGIYVDERFADTDRLSQKLRVFTAFRAHSKDRPEVIVVDDMQSLTSEVFTNMLSDRSDIGEEERREAKNIFHLMGRWFDRNDNILYLKVVPRVFFQDILTGKERYVNNALYDTTNNIFIHKNAAKSSELGFGLVIAHERGKRAFFNNKLFVKFRGLIAAEFTGNLYELVFLLGYFARFLRGNIKQNIAIAVGAFLSVQIFVILGVPFFSNLFIASIVVTLTSVGILLAFFLKCVIRANLLLGSLPMRFFNVINAVGKGVVREMQWRALTRELKEKAEMEKLIMEESADRPGIIRKIVRIVLLIPVFLFFPSEAFGAGGIFVKTGLDVLINILPLWGIVAIGALITGKYIISTPSKTSPVGGALKDIDIGAGDEDAERVQDKVMEESKDKTVVSAEIPPVPVVPEIDLAGVLVDELSGLSRLKEIMPRLEGVELDVLKKMEKMVRGADTLLLRALWIKVVSHFARELFGNIRPGEHASVLLVPFYGTDLDMISQQKLLTEPKFGIQRALRDYAKVHVIYYMADLKGAALKLQIEEKVKEIMNLNGFTEAKGKKDDPLARVIAFVEGDEKNREARDHIERILSGSDLSQNKITGVVSGAFRPEMETERFSLGFLTEFGVGLMERDRVKGEKELLTKIDKALSDMLLSMVSNPEQFEGLAPENIIEGLLNGMFCMRIAKINFQEMRELMEAEKAIRVSL
ncbi:MAG: hypothetical protein KAI70_06135, partial [Candidatus Omnitrophica bacterium]|nr:hypothetical protein [Candidatus Omnitrophota bacterium]